MNIKELKERLSRERHDVGTLRIECGRKRSAPGVFGIYEEEGTWVIYNTGDRGDVVPLMEGKEEEMAEVFYNQILKEEKRRNKRRKK